MPTHTEAIGELPSIEDRASFQFVRYANCWEDADILCEALQPRPGTRALSISSAGDNTLALLAAGAEVVAVDLSVPQLACLELRCVAFRRLEYLPLLAFLGVRSSRDRPAIYERLEQDLSPVARSYWRNHGREVQNGIIHGGKMEAYFRLFRTWVLPLIHSRKTVAKLFQPKDKAARRAFWDQTWNNRRWRALCSIFFSRAVMGRAGRDPEFFRFADGSIAERILERTEYALTHLPTHDNPYLDYVAHGNFTRALPRYLREDQFAAVRGGLDHLTIVHGPVEEAAAKHSGRGFDAFNLSDIFEYLDPAMSQHVYGRLLDVANAGARLAYWNTFVQRSCPLEFSDRVRSREQLARELFARDKAFFYSALIVDEVL